MNAAVAQRIFDVQDAARRDEAYRRLMQEHEVLNERFLETVRSLPEDRRNAIDDYLGLVSQMHLRLLELACERHM